jgi:hypothetical protein
MIIGLEYPIAGIRRDTLEQVRNTLAGIAAQIQLQEGPAPGVVGEIDRLKQRELRGQS